MSSLRENQLWQLTLVRLRDWLREPEAVFWTFFFPVLMALGLGFAFREQAPEPVQVGVVRETLDPVVFDALREAEETVPRWIEREDVDAALRDGHIALVVEAGPDGLVYRYDPTRPETRAARLAVDAVIQYAAGRRDVRSTEDVHVTTRGSRYIDFLIPGLIGLNLLSAGLWGVGFAIVRMRNGQLLKRLMATPMRRRDFMLSFLFGRLAFLVVELAILLTFAWLVFDVVTRGSLLAVLAIAVLGAFSFNGLAMLVASRARTTEGVSGLMNVASLPMWILSGVFFSYDNFPEAMQPFIRALPLTALLDALRAVMNDGASLLATIPELVIVIAWGLGCTVIALAIFRWR